MYYSHIIYKHEPLFDFLSSVFDRKKPPLSNYPSPTHPKEKSKDQFFILNGLFRL